MFQVVGSAHHTLGKGLSLLCHLASWLMFSLTGHVGNQLHVTQAALVMISQVFVGFVTEAAAVALVLR